HSTGTQRSDTRPVERRAESGRHMAPDGDNAVPLAFTEIVCGEIGHDRLHCDSRLLRKALELPEADARLIHSSDVMARFGERETVATLAFSETETLADRELSEMLT